jgi:hypothetical protein
MIALFDFHVIYRIEQAKNWAAFPLLQTEKCGTIAAFITHCISAAV